MNTKIVTDSCADLPIELVEKYNISVVPLEVRFNDKAYVDGVDLSSKEFYDMMKSHKDLPKTASPSPEQFINEFEGPEDHIIVVTISSGLSSTYNSALLAKDIYEKSNKNKKIYIIDSLSASVGEGLVVLKTAQMLQSGIKINELIDIANKCAQEVQVYFMLETLENIVKGGRIDKVTGQLASILSIKLIMKSDGNGVVDLAEKARGSKKAFNRLVDIIGENGANLENRILGIAHANCYDKALEYKKMIEAKYNFKDIIISTIGATIGTYSGEGGLLIAVL
ncbi:MAG: DegV family protein [Tissierellaceae bacterium]|nr:DegV family protein [Tissierellaceae bacterium]